MILKITFSGSKAQRWIYYFTDTKPKRCILFFPFLPLFGLFIEKPKNKPPTSDIEKRKTENEKLTYSSTNTASKLLITKLLFTSGSYFKLNRSFPSLYSK
jgi:hypothetical protein